MGKGKTVPLVAPIQSQIVSSSGMAGGQPIPPIERIKIFSSNQWEDFILEWADSLRFEYSLVERCGGAGDMGRDIVATCVNPKDGWDYYQCKHYKNPLHPSDIWVEIGKLVYYSTLQTTFRKTLRSLIYKEDRVPLV